MNRSMMLLAAVFAVFAVAMIWQAEFGGGVDRPWMECKENMVTQMFTGECTPRDGRFRMPTEDGETSPDVNSDSVNS